MDKLNGCFFIKYDDLLEKYNTIWDKDSNDIEKEFNSKPMKLLIFTIKNC